MATSVADAKQAAIELWTSDPCGHRLADGDPGTLAYLRKLLAARRSYGPWMSKELDYAGAQGLRVLDVGCGQGVDLVEYALAGAEVVGIDLTPRHVELARAHLRADGLTGTVALGDAEALPFADRSFDKVSSNGVLHHTPDIEAALREIWRVLKPGGQATVIVYNRASLHYWLGQVLRRGVLKGDLFREGSMAAVLSSGVEYSSIGARPLVRVYSRSRIQSLLKATGFVQVTAHARHFEPPRAVTATFARVGMTTSTDAAVWDRIGRLAGWYLVARGQRPGT